MTIESENQNAVSKDAEESRMPRFWAFHPLGRGIVTGALCSLFTFKPTTLFRSGFTYGVLSGLGNVGLRVAIDKDAPSPEKKALNYLAAAALPWVGSVSLMHQLYKRGGNGFYRLNPSAAMLTALCIEFAGDTNNDLLELKK